METLNWAIRIFFNFRWNVNRICHQKNIYNVWKEQPFDTRASGCVKWIWFFSFVLASIRPFAMQGLRIGSSNFFLFFFAWRWRLTRQEKWRIPIFKKNGWPKNGCWQRSNPFMFNFLLTLESTDGLLTFCKPTGLQKK